MSTVLIEMDFEQVLYKKITRDLQRYLCWSRIIPFLEENNKSLRERIKRSPAIYSKYTHWLLGSERLRVAQVLVYQALNQQEHLSQGGFVRLLVNGSDNKRLTNRPVKANSNLCRYWTNQIRNNIQPIMADYFNLIVIQWEGESKPGCGEYSIYASDLLVDFFTQELYKESA